MSVKKVLSLVLDFVATVEGAKRKQNKVSVQKDRVDAGFGVGAFAFRALCCGDNDCVLFSPPIEATLPFASI